MLERAIFWHIYLFLRKAISSNSHFHFQESKRGPFSRYHLWVGVFSLKESCYCKPTWAIPSQSRSRDQLRVSAAAHPKNTLSALVSAVAVGSSGVCPSLVSLSVSLSPCNCLFLLAVSCVCLGAFVSLILAQPSHLYLSLYFCSSVIVFLCCWFCFSISL